MNTSQASERAMRIAQEVAERTTLEHYRLVLNEDREPSITGSKIGGLPYWPKDKEYPCDAHGAEMMMIMQINCKEAGLRAPLPEQGMLQWFISVDPERMYGCRGNYDEGGEGFRIVYHDSIVEDADLADVPTCSIVDPALTPVKREVAIDVATATTVLGVSDGHFNRLFFEIVKEITGADHPDKAWYEYLDNEDCRYFEQNLGMKRPCHQMLGYPVFSQEDARIDIERHNRLLFQLDSQFSVRDRKELVMWGDMGSGFVFVNDSDLAARDFSHSYYCWDCG